MSEDAATAKIWPVDFSALAKGDVVHGATLAREWGLDLTLASDHKQFQFKLMALCETINQQTRARGLMAAIRKGNICVLKDTEYTKRQRALVSSASRKILKAVTLPAPDLRNLTPDEVMEWDTGDRFAQRNAAKLLEARKETSAITKALKAGAKRPSLRS